MLIRGSQLMIRVYEVLNLEILGLFWPFFRFFGFSISDFLTVLEFWAFFRLFFFWFCLFRIWEFFRILSFFGIFWDLFGLLGNFGTFLGIFVRVYGDILSCEPLDVNTCYLRRCFNIWGENLYYFRMNDKIDSSPNSTT